jgi:hypothetical protein
VQLLPSRPVEDTSLGVDGRQRRAPAWTFGLVAVLGALIGLRGAETSFGDSDVLWGIRAGLDMIRNGRLPHTATHSWTAQGRTWVPNSWGWDLVLGATYRIGGLAAIGALSILFVTALALLIARAARRIDAHPGWTALLLAVAMLGMLHALEPRPQIVDFLMIFILPPLLPTILFGEPGRAGRAAAALAGLQVLWINLHTSAVLGPVILAAAGAGLLVNRGDGRRQAATRLAGVLTLATGCCLVTPLGLSALTNIAEVRRSSVGLITEWTPAGIHGAASLLGLGVLAVALLAMSVAARARRFDTVAVLVVLAVATASAVRFAPMVLLYMTPELAVAAGHTRLPKVVVTRLAVTAGAILLALGIQRAGSFVPLDAVIASPSLVAELPPGCRLVNDYQLGGEVLLARPDVSVAIDGRNDMYGRTLLLSIETMLRTSPAGTTARLDADGVNCVLAPSSNKLVTVLSDDPAWRVVGEDGYRTLLVRNPG